MGDVFKILGVKGNEFCVNLPGVGQYWMKAHNFVPKVNGYAEIVYAPTWSRGRVINYTLRLVGAASPADIARKKQTEELRNDIANYGKRG